MKLAKKGRGGSTMVTRSVASTYQGAGLLPLPVAADIGFKMNN